MQITTKILIVVALFFSFTGMVKADSAPLTKQTTFYFQKDGQPLTPAVKFTVKCYGTSAMGGDNKLLKISEASETCQVYGCKFDTPNIFAVSRKNTRYCDLTGEVNSEKFAVNNFLGDNLSGLNCHRADYDSSTGDKYYKETPKYQDCQKNVNKEYYPAGNGEVKGDFICHKSLVAVPENECLQQYGYMTIDGQCYKFTSETYACIAEKEQKQNLCAQYLEDVTSKLAKNKNGYPFDEICEAKINIPSSVSNTSNVSNNQPAQNQNVESTPPVKQSQSKNIFTRITGFFRCSFLKLFGKSC